MLALHNWQNFYLLTGTAAATLIGLLFVAISIGAYIPEKQARDYLHTFVNPTLIYYFQVLLVSCLAIMPLQNALFFGGALAVLGGINIFLVLKVVWRIQVVHSKDGELDSGHWIWHVILPSIMSLLFIGSAVGFFIDEPLALPGLALAELFCLSIGVHNTWVLTIWLTLHRGQPSVMSSNATYEEKVQ